MTRELDQLIEDLKAADEARRRAKWRKKNAMGNRHEKLRAQAEIAALNKQIASLKGRIRTQRRAAGFNEPIRVGGLYV